MSTPTKVTKSQLLKLIDELEKSPQDKGRILGDVGITIIGAGLGAAAAGTLATAAGVTSIFGVTSVAGWLGLTVVAVTPVGWLLGGAAAAGAAAYTVSRLIRSGGLAEGTKAELLYRYREEARIIAAKEAAGSMEEIDRTRFIVALRDLIDKDVIPPDVAFRFIEQVEKGSVPISHAFSMIHSLLKEVGATGETNDIGKPDSADDRVDRQAQPPPKTASAPTDDFESEKDAANGNASTDFRTAVASNFQGLGRAIFETGSDLMAKAEPGIASVTSNIRVSTSTNS